MGTLPFTVATELGSVLDKYQQRLKVAQRSVQRSVAEDEMKAAVAAHEMEPYLVHYLRLPGNDKFSLVKATRMVKNKPVLVFSRIRDEVRATALVPRQFVKGDFNAENWVRCGASVLKADGSSPRGQDPALHYNMKVVKIGDEEEEKIMEHVINIVNNFARNKLS